MLLRGACLPPRRAGMHGGIFVLEPYNRFRLRAEEFVNRAREESTSEERRLWLDLALECLRLAARAHTLRG
jgi:hypothetical protein